MKEGETKMSKDLKPTALFLFLLKIAVHAYQVLRIIIVFLKCRVSISFP